MKLLRALAAGTLILGGVIAGEEPRREERRVDTTESLQTRRVAYWDDFGNRHDYEIPDVWLIPRREGETHYDRVRLWHEQTLLALEWERTHDPARALMDATLKALEKP